jgi:hypothetical protein
MTIFKNIYFWVMTLVLLAVAFLSGLRIIPPMYATYQQNQQSIIERQAELDKQQKFLAAVNAVRQDETALDSLYAQAQTALPSSNGSESLMLQLDGLLGELSINASIDVPLSVATTEGQATQNQLEVSISGDINYTQTRTLISRLKSFARWNKIKSFNIAKTNDDFSTTISFFAFFKPGKVAEFSGDSAVMTKANQVFDSLRSYSTTPDSTTEGNYGRSNPFSP